MAVTWRTGASRCGSDPRLSDVPPQAFTTHPPRCQRPAGGRCPGGAKQCGYVPHTATPFCSLALQTFNILPLTGGIKGSGEDAMWSITNTMKAKTKVEGTEVCPGDCTPRTPEPRWGTSSPACTRRRLAPVITTHLYPIGGEDFVITHRGGGGEGLAYWNCGIVGFCRFLICVKEKVHDGTEHAAQN